MHPDWIVPDGLPDSVGALMTTRAGGCSGAPWHTMNVGAAVGDAAADVARNRERLARAIGARPLYLRQLHGVRVVRLHPDDASQAPHEADASVCTERGVACTVLVADCLPVLFAAPDGAAVAAAHAGWRGLAAGIVEATVGALCEAAHCAPQRLHAWLGPCIGPRRFEVGADVVAAFGGGARFVPAASAAGVPKWHADLAGLARDRLRRQGIERIAGGAWCTVEDGARFFSYRRDGITGRMAALIWRRP
jgi:YfiH family protein